MVTSNVLERRFNPTQPDQALVTDIAYIKTLEGCTRYGHGLVLPTYHWLVHDQTDNKGTGLGCTADGSMSRRGNCHDNAVDESFFQLLKRERIKWKIYPSREAAKMDVFNYIEMFYNPKRRHGSNDGLSSVEYERRYFNEAEKCLSS